MTFPYRFFNVIVDRTISVISVNTTYQALYADSTILADASSGVFTVTLPPVAASRGRRYYIKKTDSSGNAVTISGGS